MVERLPAVDLPAHLRAAYITADSAHLNKRFGLGAWARAGAGDSLARAVGQVPCERREGLEYFVERVVRPLDGFFAVHLADVGDAATQPLAYEGLLRSEVGGYLARTDSEHGLLVQATPKILEHAHSLPSLYD